MDHEGKIKSPPLKSWAWMAFRSFGDRSTSGAESPVRWPPDFIGQLLRGINVLCVGDRVNHWLAWATTEEYNHYKYSKLSKINQALVLDGYLGNTL